LWRVEDNVVDDLSSDPEVLLKIARTRMPFGKYKGRLLIDLPEPYVVWFARNGFPKGELGRLLNILYEVKLNGLEYLFKPLRGPGG
jgi:uncharacterized protein